MARGTKIFVYILYADMIIIYPLSVLGPFLQYDENSNTDWMSVCNMAVRTNLMLGYDTLKFTCHSVPVSIALDVRHMP